MNAAGEEQSPLCEVTKARSATESAATNAPPEALGAQPSCEARPPSLAEEQRVLTQGGFHVFDAHYVMLGFNWQNPCGSTAFELEVSGVPIIWDQLWWLGAYAAVGFQQFVRGKGGCTVDVREDPEDTSDSRFRTFRGGGGVGGGWRFLAADAGLVYNEALEHRWAFRGRAGISLANELFSGGSVEFSRMCCMKEKDATPCECPRTPVGVSLFLYYAYERYWNDPPDNLYHARRPDPTDGMFGLSFKVGFGL